MAKVLRFLFRAVIAIVVLAVLLAALLAYLVYVPRTEPPRLSGTVAKGSMTVAGVQRTYRTYIPEGFHKGAPLVIVLHGSGESGEAMRRETGNAFERLADRYGFALAFPDAYHGYWDICGVVGAVKADDVGFLVALTGKLANELGLDPNRVFATGSSRGGSMVLRLALEAPRSFRAVAAVSGSVPAPENFKCKPAGGGTPSVMIMNGTSDPIVPFEGGNVSLYGIFYRNGKVRSSRASAQYFADLNHIAGKPVTHETPMGDVSVEEVTWRDASPVEVELVAIHGAGHGLPQPYRPRPRILGPTTPVPNGAEMIWNFFARQR